MCDSAAIDRIREQTEENSKAISDLAKTNAVQNEQIKTLFNTTKAQGETIEKQGDTQLKLVNRLIMAIIAVFVIVVLALIYGAIGRDGFKAVTQAAPDIITTTTK